MGAGLIDPLNEDTYDDRVIVHSSIIKSQPPTEAYRRGWERVFGAKMELTIIWNRRNYVVRVKL